MRRQPAGVATLCWLVLSTGCAGAGSSATDPGSADPARAGASDSAGGPATPVDPASGSPDAAGGDALTTPGDAPVLSPGRQGLTALTRLPHRLPGGKTWQTEAVSPQGELVIDVARQAQPGAGGELVLHQSRLALLDPAAADITYLPGQRRHRPTTQVVGVDVTRRWVAWVETPSTNLYEQDWSLYAHDRRTSATRRLATSPQVSVSPPPTVPHGTMPSIDGDRVYVSAIAQASGRQVVPGVFSVDLAGRGRLRLEARGGYASAAGHGSLVFVRGAGREWSVVARDIATGNDRVVGQSDGREQLAGMASDGRTTAWAKRTGLRHALQVAAEPGAAPATVIEGTQPLGYLRMLGPDVAFSTPASPAGYAAYLWDPAGQRLARVTDAALVGSPGGNGSVLAWAPLARDGTSPAESVARLTWPEG